MWTAFWYIKLTIFTINQTNVWVNSINQTNVVIMIAERLEKVRVDNGYSNKKDFTDALGITDQSYRNYMKGERVIPTDVLIKVKRLFGVSVDWLLDGDKSDDMTKHVSIKQFDVALSAGAGNLPAEFELQVGERPFDIEWLSSRGLQPENLSLVNVQGDSMEPMFKDRDVVMVDHSRTRLNANFPFAVYHEGSLYIKFVQKKENTLTLHSVNTYYPPIHIDLEKEECKVIGSVVWQARSWL